MEDDKKAVWSRGGMLFIGGLVLLGLILVWVGLSRPVNLESRTGTIVLSDQRALDDFARAVVLHDLNKQDYLIEGDTFPYVVRLTATLPLGADFPYGSVGSVSVWDAYNKAGSIAAAFGVVLLIMAGVMLVLTGIWPKWANHNLRLKAEWVPSKKKGEDENLNGSAG